MKRIKTKRDLVFSVILIGLLLSTITLLQPAVAEEPSYENISVQQAKDMIDHTPGLLVLDVRNQSEFALGHLYGALSIPVYELENMTSATFPATNNTFVQQLFEQTVAYNLQSHINDTIVVYCAGGSRSPIAAQILEDQGYSNVYNMLGGINAWMQDGYSIYTTYHNVTANNAGGDLELETQPLLLSAGCTTCNQNNCSNESGPVNTNITLIEQGDNYTVNNISFQFNETQINSIVTQTTLWNYSESTASANKTGSFSSVSSTGDVTSEFYILSYQVTDLDFTFKVTTKLTLLDSETYNASETTVSYKPTGQSKFVSLELVNLTSPVTLSDLYKTLETVSNKIGNMYERDGTDHNETALIQLSQSYHLMALELGTLSNTVETQLQEFNMVILQNIALLTDDICDDCQYIVSAFLDILACTAWGYIVVVAVCAAMGPLAPLCGVVAAVAIAAVCFFGVPPYALNICQYGGYCSSPVDYNYISQTTSTDHWGQGAVNNPGGMVGSANDNSYAQLWGGNYGDGGQYVGLMNAVSTGHIVLFGYSQSGYYSHLYVFVSYNNNNDWYNPTNYSQEVSYEDGQHWIDAGTYSGTFRYIAIVGIDDYGMSANLFIDSVMVD